MFVFEEVITYSAEAKTQSSQYACISSSNRKGGLVAKDELRPLGGRICPSTKLAVGLMNSQCKEDNPFSSNLFPLSLGNLNKERKKRMILFHCGVVFSNVLFGGFSTAHMTQVSYQDLFLSAFESKSS